MKRKTSESIKRRLSVILTHVFWQSSFVDNLSLDGGDLMSQTEVDQFDVKPASTVHDHIVRLDVEMNYTAVVQELNCIQYLITHSNIQSCGVETKVLRLEISRVSSVKVLVLASRSIVKVMARSWFRTLLLSRPEI